MGIKAWIAACAAAMVCASAGEAGANIVTLTFVGTVAADSTHAAIDNEGLFGSAGASLVGDTFTAVIKYDDAKGFIQGGPGWTDAAGGTIYPFPNPTLQSTLTINGKSVQRLYNYFSQDGMVNLVDAERGYYIYDLDSQQFASFAPGADGLILAYHDVHTVNQNSFFNSGSFSFDSGQVAGILIANSATADPLIAAAPIPPTPTPEPATWAMMLLGAGALGAAMRTRRRQGKAALAV